MRPAERLEEGGQLRSGGTGQPEVAGVHAVPALSHHQEAPILLEPLIGEGAVRVDRVDGLLGVASQVLGAERDRELGQHMLTSLDVHRVESGPVHLAQGVRDDLNLLGGHRAVARSEEHTSNSSH